MPAKGKVVRLEDIPWRRNDDPRDWLNYKRLLWEETGSKELCVGLGELPPGRVLGLHHHVGDAEFYYVLSGRAKVTVEDMEVDATPGTAIYIPPSAKHSIVNDGTENFVMVYGLDAPTRRFVWDEPLTE
ncbi:MAG: cupin domain-containing protein [Candidatus Bathyarchaeota archaeon]